MASTVLALPAVVNLLGAAVQGGDQSYPILQTLLHALVQQLGLTHTSLEFRGSDSTRIQELLEKKRDLGPTGELKIVLDTGSKEEESENVLSDIHADVSRDKKSMDSEASYVVESGEMTVMQKRRSNQVSVAGFSRLEAKVKSIQAQVESLGIQVLPSDEQLLSKTRSGDQVTPISDLWQSMNITKRMSGAEEGIDKLASLLETVAKEYADLKLLLDKMQDELGLDVVETMKEIKLAADYAKKMRPRAQLYEKALVKREKSGKDISSAAEGGGEEMVEAVSGAGTEASESEKSLTEPEPSQLGEHEEKESVTPDVVSELDEAEYEKFRMLPDRNEETTKINNLTMDQELIRRQMEFMMAQINTLADFSEKILPEILEGLPGMEELKKKIAAIRGKTGSQMTITMAEWEVKRATLTMEQRVEDIESRVASHASKLRRQDALFCDKYDTVLNRLRDVEASLTNIRLKFNMDDSSNDQDNLFDPQNIKMLMEKNLMISDEISELYQDMNNLKTELNKQQYEFAGVVEEIEGIHSTKVDRFEIDDILADKADCSEVQCKVSTDIFEEFCNSLTKGVDFAIKNTVEQEKQWHKELEKMLDEMEKKFNIVDVAPLKEELEKKINEVSTRLDQVARMKTYTMSAGSKRRLYTEVNCVACDKKAAMELDDERKSAEHAASMKPYLNAKPYISVELEQLKKMRLKNPGGKNLQLHEQIMKNYAISVGFDLLPEHEVSFVNRYCGGADTLLNPRQRVAKAPRTNVGKCQNPSTSR